VDVSLSATVPSRMAFVPESQLVMTSTPLGSTEKAMLLNEGKDLKRMDASFG